MTNKDKICNKIIEKSSATKISYSQFTTFHDCPEKFRRKYVLGDYRSDYNINLVFGSSVHESVQFYVEQIYSNSHKVANKIDLHDYLFQRLCINYEESLKKNFQKHFSNNDEMQEFYEDGCNILDELKQDCEKHFPKHYEYIGSELHIVTKILEDFDVNFQAYIDSTFFDTDLDKIVIFDYKTSKSGWNESNKSDEYKLAQLRLYKYFVSKIYDIPLEDIEIKFVILKRKIWEGVSKYESKRISHFVPSSGKKKIQESFELIKDFVELNFTNKGSYIKDIERKANPSKFTCTYCPFNVDCEHTFK